MSPADRLKLTTYFGERDRAGRRSVADALLDLYAERALRASVLLRGVEGFGLQAHLRSDRKLSLSEDLPLVSVAVDTPARIDAVLPDVLRLHAGGLVTIERASVMDPILLDPPPGSGDPAEAMKLTLYLGRRQAIAATPRSRGGQDAAALHRAGRGRGATPAHVAVCDLMRVAGVAGATALLGVDGTRRGVRSRAATVGRNAGVPLMLIAVGAAPALAAVLEALDGLLEEPPLGTLERVRITRRDGERVGPPHGLGGVPIPPQDGDGPSMWQKLMVHTSELARHDGRSLHRELVARLRREGIAGATVLRGVFGFRGAGPVMQDRLLALRRRVPVVTIVVDRPERIAAAHDTVAELTAEGGLVTSELVPAYEASAADVRRGGLRLAG